MYFRYFQTTYQMEVLSALGAIPSISISYLYIDSMRNL
jgi:hypothetical protein